MNMKRVCLFLLLIFVAAGVAVAQRSANSGVSATVTTKPGVGRARFYIADVQNTNPHNVSVEVVFTVTRGGDVARQSTRVIVPKRQTKSIQIVSGTDLRVRIVELKVTALE